MARLLFRLNDVPEDEINAVREILETHNVDVYETDSGKWGISVAAIWLREDEEYDYARALIEEYQRERQTQVQSDEEPQTLLERCQQRPVECLLVACAILATLALTVWPFVTAFSD